MKIKIIRVFVRIWLPVKGQRVEILVFMDYVIVNVATELCHCNAKIATNNMQTPEHGYILRNFIYKTRQRFGFGLLTIFHQPQH